MIHLILYIDQQSGERGRHLERVMQKRFPEYAQEICPDLMTLIKVTRKPIPFKDLQVFVLLADTMERLEKFHLVAEYLEDKKLLLIISDNDRSTFCSCFRLWPRFVTQTSQSFADICDVVEKMIENHHRNRDCINM